MRNYRWFLVIVSVYLLSFILHTFIIQKTVYGDGIFYFSWLRSVVIDHDINFRNEYTHFQVGAPLSPTGNPGNVYSVGPALFWLPIYFLMHTFMGGNGYELPYQIAVAVVGVLLGLFGLTVLYKLLTRMFTENVSILTTCSLALATNLYYYASVDTVNSHALSFFVSVILLYLVLEPKRNWLIIGIFLGLLGLIRIQDLIFGLILLPFLTIRNLPKAVVGTLIGFLPQLLAWQALYGTFLTIPYLSTGNTFDFLHPHVLSELFAPWYGLFFFSPILILGFICLFFLKQNIRPWALAVIVAEILIVGSWSVWWQGATVGNRMLISSLPLFSLGLGYFFTWFTKQRLGLVQSILIIVVPLSLLNILMTFSYLVLH